MESGNVRIRYANSEDAAEIAEIYNQGIKARQATFETTFITKDNRKNWIESQDHQYPILVAEYNNNVVGWTAIAPYRSRECYRGIGEFSVYIDHSIRGQGVGKLLLSALIDTCAKHGFWKLTSRIFVSNKASRRLCKACGFREVGIYQKHAKLEGQWIDCLIVEKLIDENIT